MTTVWEEKLYNARLTKSLPEFIDIMNNLNLAYPKKMGNYSSFVESFVFYLKILTHEKHKIIVECEVSS